MRGVIESADDVNEGADDNDDDADADDDADDDDDDDDDGMVVMKAMKSETMRQWAVQLQHNDETTNESYLHRSLTAAQHSTTAHQNR